MENIAFVLWMCLWPVACTLEGYLSEKKRAISGEERPSDSLVGLTALIQIIIWIAVAISL